MQLGRDLGGLADAAAVPLVSPAAAVAAAALDQQAAGEEDGAGGPHLLPQVDRVVAGGAAVSLDVVVEAVEVNWIRGGDRRLEGLSLTARPRYCRSELRFLAAAHLKTPNWLITERHRRRSI